VSEKRSDTSVSGKSFVRGRTIEEEERHGRPQAARVVRRITEARRALPQSKTGKAVQKALGILSGRRPFRPTPSGPPDAAAARRATVKVNYVANRKQGQWAAHGDYLERENAQQDGEKGHGFDALEDEIALRSRLHDWQMSGDPRLFKVILAPEDGDRLHLREYTREYMARLAPHLSGRPDQIEWAAIDHYNTGHPHVHVLIRGNHALQIPPELIRSGMRNLASEVATERLGYRLPSEIQRAKEKQIDAPRLTPLDREIERQAKPLPNGMSFVSEIIRTPRDPGYAGQRLRIRRLEALEGLGLAEKIGSATWALDAGWTKGLRDLEALRTRTKMLAQSRALMTEPRCPPQVTKLKPGERLVGRVLGTGLDEQYDRSYVLVEGTDYRAHIVYQNAAIERARSAQSLQLRHLVALEGKSFERDGKTIPYTTVEDYGLTIPDKPTPIRIPEKALDDALDAGTAPADPAQAATGFQRYWHEQLLERSRQRAREKEKAEREQRAQEKEQASLPTPESPKPPLLEPAPSKTSQPAHGREDVDLE
jgi:hypothetical protein